MSRAVATSARRQLLLLRHAKSSWDDASLPDHQRPLAPRGVDAAIRIGRYLEDEGLGCDLVLCSSAVRAVETLDLVRPSLGRADVETSAALYTATRVDLFERLHQIDAARTSVMIVGHNPAIQELAITLVGGGDEAALTRLRAKFPTGALAVLDVGAATWERLGRGWANLDRFVRPRDLGPVGTDASPTAPRAHRNRTG